jgi:hypothetical protein
LGGEHGFDRHPDFCRRVHANDRDRDSGIKEFKINDSTCWSIATHASYTWFSSLTSLPSFWTTMVSGGASVLGSRKLSSLAPRIGGRIWDCHMR